MKDRAEKATPMSWVEGVRAAIAYERFILHAQPIIDLGTGQTVCEELLVRMLDERGKLVPPADFLPAAERFGLIREIDRLVVGKALRLARTGRVAVNLSGHSIGDPQLTDLVQEAVEQGLDPHNVIFEVTETAAVSNIEQARAFAERLLLLGCELALDDFGTGFGSFT